MISLDTNPIVNLFVTSESSSSERRFNKDITIDALKVNLSLFF